MSEPTARERAIIDSLLEPLPPEYVPPREIPWDRKESAVYFILVGGFIKIGWTSDWKSRMSQIQTSNPHPIEILLIIGRPKIFEKTMHRKFSALRATGEWFRDHPEIREYIEGRKDECWHRAGRRK